MKTVVGLDASFTCYDPVQMDFAALHARYPVLEEFSTALGNTELCEVPNPDSSARIFAKLEWQNPTGSIKDRVAYALICGVLAECGELELKNLKILEYSGGNLAEGLSFLGSRLGLQMRFVLSSGAPASLLSRLEQRQSKIDLVNKELGFIAVINKAVEIAQMESEWTLLYQHRNILNTDFHQRTTGAEIVSQLGDRRPTAWVASIGTGGTLVGVADALRKAYPTVRIVAVSPAELPYGSLWPPNGQQKYGGSGGMGCGIKQPFVLRYDSIIEEKTVGFKSSLRAMVEFRRLTGMKIGSSAAANWLAARDVASELATTDTVITVFPCSGTPEEWRQAER
jgi:cysteine synthase A